MKRLGMLFCSLVLAGTFVTSSAYAQQVTLDVLYAFPAFAKFHEPIAQEFMKLHPDIKIAFRAPAPTYDDRYRFRPMDEVCTRYYLRLLAEDRPGVFAQITHALGEESISLASVIQKQNVMLGDPPVEYAEIVLMTHEATEAPMQRAVRSIAALPVVHRVGSLIRVEG